MHETKRNTDICSCISESYNNCVKYIGSVEIVTKGTFLPTLYREDLVPSSIKSFLHDVGMTRCTSNKSSLQ